MGNTIERQCDPCGLLNDRPRAKSCSACDRLKRKAYQADYDRKRHYDLDQKVYQGMLDACGGRCELCGEFPPPGISLNVDHDHKTDEIRGLLCTDCNLGLGRFHDDPRLLSLAADYIKRQEAHHETGDKIPQVTEETDKGKE